MWRWLVPLCFAGLVSCHRADASLFSDIDPTKEVAIGRQAAREFERRTPLSSDKVLQARVRRVGQALIESLESKVFPYEFRIAGTGDVNACAYPGGIVYVFEGLANCMPDDDELAFVMAHELAHAAHRHYANRLGKMEPVAVLGGLLSGLAGDSDLFIARLVTQLMWLKYSRKDEDDADRTAMDLMWAAGYDLSGALDATRILMEMGKGNNTPRYLRSHPPAKERLQHLTERAQRTAASPREAAATPTSGQVDTDFAKVVGDVSALAIAENPWFPLAVGNEWSYAARGPSGTATYSVRVAGMIPLDNGAVYRVETSLGKGASVPCQYATTAADIWRRNQPACADSPWQIECVTAFSSAESVERDGWRYVLLAKEPVTVPCGSFPDTLHIRREGVQSASIQEVWLAAGVGMLRRTCAETGVTETLIAYDIKRPWSLAQTNAGDAPQGAAAPAPGH